MRTKHWLVFAGALGALLASAGEFTLRANTAEGWAVCLVEESGGTVVRDDTVAGKPVVAVSLCGAKLSDEVLKCLTAFPRLRSLDLCRAEGVTSKRIKMLAELKELAVTQAQPVGSH